MNSNFRISLLKGKNNYALWLINIHAILCSKNGWQYTQSDGSNKITAAIQASTTATKTVAPDQAAIKRHVRRNWQGNSKKAADTITLTLHSDVKAKLTNNDFNNAFKMMTHLKQMYKPSTDTEFFMLMRDLMATCYIDFPSMETYLTHIQTLNNKVTRTKLWSLYPPTFEDASNQLVEHQRCHVSTNVISQGLQHTSFTSLLICKVCSRRHAQEICCRYPKACKPHSVDNCWKLHPEQRPEWAKRHNYSKPRPVTNVAITDHTRAGYGSIGTSFSF
ncbi:hypothetical protein EJ02DRAFT_464630 [Clathrospora elynae]|uniref:Uncharacterized protein n=1 Tax=Clathrospora elynae TaxID=706981 RepID=A0A6A5STH9_9PLEO|nr:hypothetical protein EJ02DRAFT_464630 [Clathrospora elynae]